MAPSAIVLASLLALVQAGPFVGLSIPTLGPRITGGRNAIKGEFPHQVSLQWSATPTGAPKHFCAGTILQPTWILTAGHCVHAVPPFGNFVVKAGKHNISAHESTEQTAQVQRSIVHEDYPGNVAPNDIALLRLRTPLRENQYVRRISLPRPDVLPTGRLELSGWGSVSLTSGPVYPDILQKVNLTVVDLATCRRMIERLTGSAPLANSNLCTGPLTGGISACSGDSGGPLIKNNGTRKEIVGVVSWGIVPCGTRNAPSVFTRVSAYVGWINNKINGNYEAYLDTLV
ncbi:trypsin-1-like [Copidosoma floridanum]|uniref:trypsin-1-like n=1 Tax=Copidosoma floridanum TaxID=29053 RepID=UPI0006C96715|nr:trypsin-1-like [Copidosoma floridanum]